LLVSKDTNIPSKQSKFYTIWSFVIALHYLKIINVPTSVLPHHHTNTWKEKEKMLLLLWIKNNHYINFFETKLTLKWVCTWNFLKRQSYKKKIFNSILIDVCSKNHYYNVYFAQVFVSQWIKIIIWLKYILDPVYVCVRMYNNTTPNKPNCLLIPCIQK
jgi:hypothetical protein